jgi:WD40 repeat protein
MDKTILIWTPSNSYENVATLKSHTSAITSLAFSSQDILFAGSADKTVSAWDVETEKLLRKYKGHNAIVHGVAAPYKNL